MSQKEIKKIVLTGDRPTGRLHLGHYVGSIKNRIALQEEASRSWYMIADIQALTDNADNPAKVRNNILEVALDNLACGVDPTKTTFFIQSQVPAIAELTMFFLNLVTVSRLLQNPTVKQEINQQFSNLSGQLNTLERETGKNESKYPFPAGFLMYPVSQAADILAFQATAIPVGADQIAHIEQTNEIVQKFNTLYGDVFKKVEVVISDVGRLPGLDGKAKMSKSLNNAIYLSDSNETIEEKVNAMFTDPDHIHVEDPGNVEGNVVFSYLDIFDTDKKTLEELKEQYKKGGLGDTVIKKRLTQILQDIIAPIRERREYLAQDPKKVMDILRDGTAEANKMAEETLRKVKEAIQINYF